MDINLMKYVPKGFLFKQLKKKFSKKAGFPVEIVKVDIHYKAGKFTTELIAGKKRVKEENPISEFTEMSDMLVLKIKEQISAAENKDKDAVNIDIVLLEIHVNENKTVANVYYTIDGAKLHREMTEIF